MGRIFAAMYDRVGTGFEREVMQPARRRLLADVRGRVLEIGAGTGANVPIYGRAAEVTLAEPDPHMRTRLRARVEEHGRHEDLEVVEASAESLPFDDASLDVVVSTMVLCSVDDLEAALAEVRRVLRADGRFLFIEHVRSADPRIAAWQDRLTPLQRRFAGNCHVNRDIVAALGPAGLGLSQLEEHPIVTRGDRFQPMIQGTAVPTPATVRADR